MAQAQKLLDQINADVAEVNRQLDTENAEWAAIGGGHRPEAEVELEEQAEAEQRPAPPPATAGCGPCLGVQFEADLGLRLPDAPGGSRAKQPHRH